MVIISAYYAPICSMRAKCFWITFLNCAIFLMAPCFGNLLAWVKFSDRSDNTKLDSVRSLHSKLNLPGEISPVLDTASEEVQISWKLVARTPNTRRGHREISRVEIFKLPSSIVQHFQWQKWFLRSHWAKIAKIC